MPMERQEVVAPPYLHVQSLAINPIYAHSDILRLLVSQPGSWVLCPHYANTNISSLGNCLRGQSAIHLHFGILVLSFSVT